MEEMLAESKEEHISDDQAKRDAKTIHNNNHHVVSIGVLIVLCTIYLMFAGLQTNYNFYFKPLVAANHLNVDSQEPTKNHLNIQQPNLCRQIEVFTKDNNGQPKTSNSLVLKRKSLRSTKLSENRRSRTKKKDIAKKSNTAEPIIYLFALVFIYLLLKAASDINQHYKTQNKGDKRLRRCSLQSYAQKEQRSGPHLDRRASKDALMQSRHYIFTEARSISLDRYKRREEIPIEPKIIRKPTTIGDYARPPRMGRRLSVPVSINYQTVQVSPVIGHPDLARRGSVLNLGEISALPLPLTAPTMPELKRRVRMINRH